ncbi:MAG: Site-specific DNA-methyltransferase (Adenine-specific) [Candidatus Gottesmanbacteria bacterium GW2011_GWC2_39_8]|uniref:Site-specific DNA-methyltransferase (Adenine-specific) n=1 Tax=Candidatus Gottesmanbacteria bacterium GW2011_GWC2_39_8 TaxID=1618450 RepID=A0A0G0S6X5_9BACT|nr:MAG: Site-specific DNA-methyltransferase (Adenine-specific) [Candidatus Gottesmanbacteria bacterium GW2011_GWC2_39_8]
MKKEFRLLVADKVRKGEELSIEWATELFPGFHFSQKRESELLYGNKEREEDVIANTLAVPFQKVRTFGGPGVEWDNKLIFGDNLQALKTLVEMKKTGKLCNSDGTPGARLIYIDPPFATRQDMASWNSERAYTDKIAGAEFIEFLRKRLVLLKELLSDDGSIFVHLDWKKSHYIKVILDELFGEANFRNEIVWFYPRGGDADKQFNRKHDNILWYSKSSSKWVFNWKDVLIPYTKEQLERFKETDKDGRKFYWNVNPRGETVKTYLHKTGIGEYDVWNIGINATAIQALNYPTQKPEKLLERIIKAASNSGDLILDCFAGSGTTLVVAEKMSRRWVGIDCGKLSIYTIQKRFLKLDESKDIKNPGKEYAKPCTPFTLYNAGLYDFSALKELPRDGWRWFALKLFGCTDEPHQIGGIQLDGKKNGAPVLVFDHHNKPDARVTEETIQDINSAIGDKIGRKCFIIAPRGCFDFQQDYIDLGNVRYYALRIPYSVINELHARGFQPLRQPNDETAVNNTVDAVGFDFIQRPSIDYSVVIRKPKGEQNEKLCLQINKFESKARIRGEDTKGGLETFSMLMLDSNYNAREKVFNMEHVVYAHQLEANNWETSLPITNIGESLMVIAVDVYGNEACDLLMRKDIKQLKKNSEPVKSKRKR